MRALLLLAILVSCALFVHTAYATSSTVGSAGTKQGGGSLVSYAVPVFIGIFTYTSNDPTIPSQPNISAPNVVIPTAPNVTQITPNVTSALSPLTSNATEEWLAQFSPFTPQNAYSTFVSQLNQTVQAIFWGQFNYTEQKTNEGLAAMNQVQQNGGSAEQAREAFIQNASTSRSDITTVNNNLNVQYANANSTVQQEFDQWGDLR